MASAGFSIQVHGEEIACHAELLLLPLDLPQKSDVTGMVNHNGYFACLVCRERGENINRCRCYLSEELCEFRTVDEVLHAHEIEVASKVKPVDDPVGLRFTSQT